MHHVAIMKPSWHLIPKIVSGEKSVESRWYQVRCAPWNRVAAGDTIFFKDSGQPVTARAEVERVLQISLKDIVDARKIIRDFGKELCLVEKDPATWKSFPRYCVLMFLKNPSALKEPIEIDKTGFGSAAAWLTVPHIAAITRKPR